MSETNYSTDVEYETKDKKKFQITRGMVILAVLALVILITIIIIIVKVTTSGKKEEYTSADFNKLEARMIEEAPTYISQKSIILTDKEIRIDLKELLIENGGFIDSAKVKAAKVCNGYVIASKQESEKYSSYIKCGNMYTTTGYISNDKENNKTTTTTVKDTVLPTITLVGESEISINQGANFEDQGAKATDNIDGDITSKIVKSGGVDTKKVGSYVITYSVTDKAGNKADVKRTVKVIPTPTTSEPITTTRQTTKKSTSKVTTKATTRRPTTPPTITLYGSKTIIINVGEMYNDPGYSATDSLGGNITSSVRVSSNLNISNPGTYYVTYQVTDNYGNKASTSRTIIVKQSLIALSGVKLSPNTLDMTPGQSKTLTVYYTPTNATDKTISWSSDNPSVATVNNGVVYARTRGTAIITVKSTNGKTDKARVTVK